jgi:RPA family protein
MKSLQEFKVVVEEEKADYSKFDALIRAGLGNKAQIQRMHQILAKMGEDKPQFTNADRAIIQNLFTKMVDLITNNPQIFRMSKKSVKEELEKLQKIEEGYVDSSDYKISPETGRKVRAHRIKIGDTLKQNDVKEETAIAAETLDEALDEMPKDPPVVLVLKRKAIRLYPDKTRIALYYNDKLNKYFSVPYMSDDNGKFPLQAEQVEQIDEAVMDTLHKIVNEKQARSVKFASGHTRKVDGYTASAITKVHSSLNDDNKKKFADMVHKSPEHFEKAASFAFKHVK